MLKHIKSCNHALYKELDRQQQLEASGENLKQVNIMQALKKGEEKKAEFSPEEQDLAARAQALLSACANLALSAGESMWFKYYARVLSRGQVVPITHGPVMTRVTQIVGREIEPKIREELMKVVLIS